MMTCGTNSATNSDSYRLRIEGLSAAIFKTPKRRSFSMNGADHRELDRIGRVEWRTKIVIQQVGELGSRVLIDLLPSQVVVTLKCVSLRLGKKGEDRGRERNGHADSF